MFILHPKLGSDTVEIVTWELSSVRLMKDALYPWLILVPMRPDVNGLHHLSPRDGATLMSEITRASQALDSLYSPDRINVGALGNMVPQLHIHVIARFENDPAWPGPVWGAHPPKPYSETHMGQLIATLQQALK